MSLSTTLRKLHTPAAYPKGRVAQRWGQILRQPADVAMLMAERQKAGALVALADVAKIAGGAVSRANAYFLVREVPFEEIPQRFGLTSRDMQRIAVVEDGLQTLHRIERNCLSEVVKGPDALVSPVEVAETSLRLFHVAKRSKDDLRKDRANGALNYLKRGETVPYSVSEDSLKGGIPAQRSQVKNRKPYWYSISTPPTNRPRIVVPEHYDRRFPASLLDATHNGVVLDKLFAITPNVPEDAEIILAGIHSLSTLYQIEFRGRTNLGEGVLEMKRADWDGLVIPAPSALDVKQRELILEAFEPLEEREVGTIAEELGDPDRVLFDTVMLDAMGVADPEAARIVMEREFRAAIGERRERASSVSDAKASSATVKRVATNVDAYASRIAASMEPYPDPRSYVPAGTELLVLISGPVEGEITIGEDLLTMGDVFAGEQRIASAGDLQRAQLVRSVLLHDPELTVVGVPADEVNLTEALDAWRKAAVEWRKIFDAQVKKTAGALGDARVKDQVRERALALLHAS